MVLAARATVVPALVVIAKAGAGRAASPRVAANGLHVTLPAVPAPAPAPRLAFMAASVHLGARKENLLLALLTNPV